MNSVKKNILVLDDDPVYRNVLESILNKQYNVFIASKPSQAFEILNKNIIHILISDYILPEMNGLEVLKVVKSKYSSTEVIVISNEGNMETVIEALRQGAADYFPKPFKSQDIWLSIERTLKISDLTSNLNKVEKHNTILKSEVNKEFGDNFIGNSAAILKVKQEIEMLAETLNTSVLIIGESGTGKELVARGIHNLSSRGKEIFGAVNMSAVPESLFESEFFGHKKGSFTGAISDRAGWFEATDKGSLFLDEIGEMSMVLQVKLLRVLEDRKFIKIGTQKEQSFDTRIISASNKLPEELTDRKNFRTDLFHRLATYVIFVPPLRDRMEDIPLLANYFLTLMNKKTGKNIKSINKSVFTYLNSYNFPGNIRELKNLMERAVIICKGKELKPEDFSSVDYFKKNTSSLASKDIWDLAEIEKNTIVKALEKVNYNKVKAANLLKLEWNALHRRIKKYNIQLPE
jgi:DNA-binding NtrC family response regulator